MSLLRDIQNNAIDGSTDLSSLLRSCTVLGARLGNDDFRNWVSNELNGYQDAKSLPDYRVLAVRSKGDFYGPFGSGLRNADIPPMSIPADFRDRLFYCRIQDPVASIQDLVKKAESSLRGPWPVELTQYAGNEIFENYNCLQAWQSIPCNTMVALLDAVRNRLLSFVLEIEAEEPDAGEAPINSEPIPDKVVSQIFNTIIMGDVQNMSAGGEHVQQTVQTIEPLNFQSLADWLNRQGVKMTDVEHLKSAINDDEGTAEAGIGQNVKRWLAYMQQKAADGSWKVGTSVAGSLLGKALARYYGLTGD
ncbi:hypothetical protein [Novipirellula sp.]|uniref:AbiTii domain-containing protein n=1 Tax=Novipirellula sp. TaxID=2795430 RepID=UPI0035689B2E